MLSFNDHRIPITPFDLSTCLIMYIQLKLSLVDEVDAEEVQ
jgi:hypothetical protein